MNKQNIAETIQIVKRYSEILDKIKDIKYPKLNNYGYPYGRWRPLDYVSTARKIFLVEPLPPAALPIYDKDPETFKISSNGAICKKCNTPNEYASANQPDGSFICCSCRLGY